MHQAIISRCHSVKQQAKYVTVLSFIIEPKFGDYLVTCKGEARLESLDIVASEGLPVHTSNDIHF
jgi:hypothetical protein